MTATGDGSGGRTVKYDSFNVSAQDAARVESLARMLGTRQWNQSMPSVNTTVETKRRVMYVAMGLAGLVFVSTVILPVSTSTAQLLAVLSFGLMSGLWLGYLMCSL